MNKFTRISVFILSLSLIIAYFVPIWDIDLEAPQYPEGLGMKIWINKLSGDINTINGLNHYIGMKFIVEDSIHELKYMPYLLGCIIVFGVIISFTKRKLLFYTWVILFAMLGIAGGIDFYLWEYDYGHNLDPHAAIIVEGMTYQPPLIGSKQLLNFTAHSFPSTGGVIILAAAFLSIVLMVYNLFEKREISIPSIPSAKPWNKPFINSINSGLIIIITLFLFSCSIKSEPLSYGTDHCDFCKMGISDQKFGAEIVTDKGKIYKFDAVECMVNFIDGKDLDLHNDIKLLLVSDAANQGNLINAFTAHYLLSENLPSPMGSNISAYGSEADLVRVQEEFSGIFLNWDEVEENIRNK